MQTFLPYPSFAESAAVLDGPRLGKQRVETLQILRALLVPTYGWQRHPVVQMWRGHVPGLTAYGLAMTDEWLGRGHADTVRPQLVEFAPEVDGVPQDELAERGLLPPWLGDPVLHESHRSRLIAKAPDFYGTLFPGTPLDLEYVWPPAPAAPPEPHDVAALGDPGRRPRQLAGRRAWSGIPQANAAGKVTPAWRQQHERFADGARAGHARGGAGGGSGAAPPRGDHRAARVRHDRRGRVPRAIGSLRGRPRTRATCRCRPSCRTRGASSRWRRRTPFARSPATCTPSRLRPRALQQAISASAGPW